MIAIRKQYALDMAKRFVEMSRHLSGSAKELALASAKSEVRRYWEIAQSTR